MAGFCIVSGNQQRPRLYQQLAGALGPSAVRTPVLLSVSAPHSSTDCTAPAGVALSVKLKPFAGIAGLNVML